MVEENDIRDVVEEEKGRGRRQPRAGINRRLTQKLLRAWPELVESGDEGTFVQALNEIGFEKGSPEFERAFALWRAKWKP